eukprot:TRINITY_DN462_c0_g4_i1.p1 TRINITY_DN462_c0_g4~~TRINITY_DN462_c0_g4_i1.p1  ORF type:complete len:315 (-),score=75.26 TRINITY_DN462_c0_g4_i1:437-1381(-)
MAFARLKRGRKQDGERSKVLGGLGLLGLAALAAVVGCNAAAFVSMHRAAPLVSGSAPAVSPKVSAPIMPSAQASASSPALAACLLLTVAAGSLRAGASCAGGRGSANGRKATVRAVERCAGMSATLPASIPEALPTAAAPSSLSPLIDLAVPAALHVGKTADCLPTAVSGLASVTFSCQPAPAFAAFAAAAHADEGKAEEATKAGFIGARAARVIGGVRYTSSRRQSQNKSGKSIRCYVAQKFVEVIPQTLSYDPSTLPGQLQAGLQLSSRVHKVYSRERKNCTACRTGACGGVNSESIYLFEKRSDDAESLHK